MILLKIGFQEYRIMGKNINNDIDVEIKGDLESVSSIVNTLKKYKEIHDYVLRNKKNPFCKQLMEIINEN